MITFRMSDWGESVGSRALGATIRLKVESRLDEGETVCLDFSGVAIASPSFIDELVGKLFLGHDERQLRQQLKITGAVPEIRALIRRMISERLKQERAETTRPDDDNQVRVGRLKPKS